MLPFSIKSHGDGIIAMKSLTCCLISKLMISREESLLVASPIRYMLPLIQLMQGHQNKVMLLTNVQTVTSACCKRRTWRFLVGVFMCNSMQTIHVDGSIDIQRYLEDWDVVSKDGWNHIVGFLMTLLVVCKDGVFGKSSCSQNLIWFFVRISSCFFCVSCGVCFLWFRSITLCFVCLMCLSAGGM